MKILLSIGVALATVINTAQAGLAPVPDEWLGISEPYHDTLRVLDPGLPRVENLTYTFLEMPKNEDVLQVTWDPIPGPAPEWRILVWREPVFSDGGRGFACVAVIPADATSYVDWENLRKVRRPSTHRETYRYYFLLTDSAAVGPTDPDAPAPFPGLSLGDLGAFHYSPISWLIP